MERTSKGAGTRARFVVVASHFEQRNGMEFVTRRDKRSTVAEATVSSPKMWAVRVTDLGSGESPNVVVVSAANWLDALKSGREELHLGHGMPAGASCTVNDEGAATVHDPLGRKTYLIEESSESESSDSPAPDPNSKGQEPDQPPPVSNKTVAYGMTALAGLSPQPREDPSESPAPTAEPTERPPTDAKASEPGQTEWTIVAERDSAPTSKNPLYYRERSYALKSEHDTDTIEQFLKARFQELKEDLEEKPRGKFLNLAVFDHEWQGKPSTAPLATLSWKDWRGDPVIAFPEEKPKANVLSEARWSAPPDNAPETREDDREDPSTTDHDVRLMRAFEASQDLLFLNTPIEGMQFVVKLLEELIPCEATTGCLYDINTDELRFVALTGPGEGERRGQAVNRSAGLMGRTVRQPGVVLKYDQFSSEEQFDEAVDGRPGFESRNALYCALAQQGRLLGVLQLCNRRRREAFTPGDVELLTYVSTQMSKFLHVARTTSHPPR